jgi:bifunctional DNA-binding transcriptional regulator/antitoxin component of YhaV-PrlF toxin-antitoxin module
MAEKTNETFIAVVMSLGRVTIPHELVKILKIEQGQTIKLAIVKIYGGKNGKRGKRTVA